MTKELGNTESAERRRVDDTLAEVKLFLPDELARAWQRCCWLLVNDTGKQRTDIMEEMVTDYLIKHGC